MYYKHLSYTLTIPLYRLFYLQFHKGAYDITVWEERFRQENITWSADNIVTMSLLL